MIGKSMDFVYAVCERIVWLFTFFVTRLFSSFKIIGRENLKNLPKPLMIISNHRTFWDPLIIGTLLPFFSSYIPVTFMVADVYYNNPLLRPLFRLTKTVPANKGKGLDVSLREPRRVLRNGGVFLIFPTGQRHHLGRAPRPRRGAAVLALEIPWLTVLPIYIRSVPGWGPLDLVARRKKITAIIGRSFQLKDITTSKNVNEVARVLADQIYKLS